MHKVDVAGLRGLLPSTVIPTELGGSYVPDLNQIRGDLQSVINTH